MKKFIMIILFSPLLFAAQADSARIGTFGKGCGTFVKLDDVNKVIGQNTETLKEACIKCINEKLKVDFEKTEETVVLMTEQCITEYRK